MKFASRHENKNEAIVRNIRILRESNNENDKEQAFSKIYKACFKIIMSFVGEKSDEYASMTNAVLWNCILTYTFDSSAQFTTFLWAAFMKESTKIKRWDNKLAPQPDEGEKANDTEQATIDYTEGNFMDILLSMKEPTYDDVYVLPSDSLFVVMLPEYLDELRQRYPEAMKFYEYASELHYLPIPGSQEFEYRYPTQADIGLRFNVTQQWVSRVLSKFEQAIGFERRKAKKSFRGSMKMEKQLSQANSSVYFRPNGTRMTSDEMHRYKILNIKEYRDDFSTQIV